MAEPTAPMPDVEEVAIAAPQSVRPSTDANVVIQLLVGTIGTILTALAVMPLKPFPAQGLGYIYLLVNARGPIQYIELFMFWMVATQIFLKIRILRSQVGAIAEGPVDPKTDLNDDVQIQEFRKRLSTHPRFSQSIVISRLDRILAMWLATKDVGRISGWAQAESDRDTAASDSSYALSRVLIWAIPILGFIGTVQGLGVAVSGFSGFLSGSAGIEEIKTAIMRVTGGLAVAFDTTFLALMLVTFLMFPLSTLQRREENFFVEVDIYLDDAVISRFPSPESKPIVIENLEDSIEAAFRRYIPDPDRYDEVFTRAIERASTTVEERFAALVKNYESALRDLSGRLAESMTSVGQSLETSMRQVVSDVRSQEETLTESRRRMVAEEAERFKVLLQDMQGSAGQIAAEYQKKAEELTAATKRAGEDSVAAAKEIAARLQDVVRLAAGIEDLLKIQEALEKGMAGLASSEEFQTTLRDLRRHLETTDAFCSRLSKPRVITFREEPS